MKVKQTVTLPHEDLEWYHKAYGGDANLSFILTLLLRAFRSVHDDTGVTPFKVARDAAKEIKAQFDEGIFDEVTKETGT